MDYMQTQRDIVARLTPGAHDAGPVRAASADEPRPSLVGFFNVIELASDSLRALVTRLEEAADRLAGPVPERTGAGPGAPLDGPPVSVLEHAAASAVKMERLLGRGHDAASRIERALGE